MKKIPDSWYEKELRVYDGEDNTDIEEKLDLSNTVERFISAMRILYTDHMCDGYDDEEELDIETMRTSYLFARELKYAIADGGEDILLHVNIFLETIFKPEHSPYGNSWFELICDDDMKINALKVMQSVQYGVIQMLMEKISDNMNGEDNEKE